MDLNDVGSVADFESTESTASSPNVDLDRYLTGDSDDASEFEPRALEVNTGSEVVRFVTRAELAHIARQSGNYEEAEAYYRQSIVGWQELGHPSALAHQVECFAYIALERGQYAHAALLLGAAGNAREQKNMLSTAPHEIAELEQALERLAAAMGEEERDGAMAEGSLMNLDDAVQIALEKSES